MRVTDVLLIDDHGVFRSGLKLLLEAEFPSILVRESDSIAATFTTQTSPDLILLDIQLPGLSGISAIHSLLNRWPEALIAMLSAHNTTENRMQASSMGSIAFFSKTESAEPIISFIHQLQQNGASALKALQENHTTSSVTHLTPRQCEVLELLSLGYSNKVIARKLDVSENTIRWHVQSLLELLQANNRSEAVFLARAQGLLC